MWKSSHQVAEYMVIIGHFIDVGWKLQKRVLSFVKVPAPRRGIDVADAIFKCLKAWGIENKVFSVSVDNASYNDSCLRNLKENSSFNRNMPPKSQMTKPMDEVAMLKALRAKERKTKAAEKNAATSVECLGTGPVQHADGTNSLEQRKKQKINEGNQPGDTGTRPPPSSSNHNALNNPTPSPTSGVSDKWRALLNDYEGSTSDVCSLFDRRYPIDQIVDKHFNLKEDRTRVQKAGMKNLGKKIQSSGSQMAFFDLCVDQYVSSAEKEVKKLLLKNRELTEKLKNHEGDMKTVEKLKTDLQASENKTAELLVEKETWAGKFSNLEKKSGDLQKKNDDLVTKNIDLENKLTKLTSDKEALIVEKDSLTAELEDTKAQVAMQHAAGFEKAINQLQFLYPDLKTDEVGAFKHIVDGKLVDITIDEDEE